MLQTHTKSSTGPLVFPVLLLVLHSSPALPNSRACCATHMGIPSQGDVRCMWSHHSLSLPLAFPVSAKFWKGRSLLDAHFPDSLMSTKAWAVPSALCKGKVGRVACPFLALPHQSTPEPYLSKALRELYGQGRKEKSKHSGTFIRNK